MIERKNHNTEYNNDQNNISESVKEFQRTNCGRLKHSNHNLDEHKNKDGRLSSI